MMQEEVRSGFLKYIVDVNFYFLASLLKDQLVSPVFVSYYLKLSLSMFLKYIYNSLCVIIAKFISLLFL